MRDLFPAFCVALASLAPLLLIPGDLAFAETAGATLKSREKSVLMGQDPGRATLLPGKGAVAAPQHEPQISEDGAGSAAMPQSLSVSLGDLASRIGGPQTSGVLDFWIEGRHEPYEVGTVQRRLESGAMTLVSAGTSYKIGPDIMIGALASLDQGKLEDTRSGADVETSGWAAGPFASVRFGGGVVLDGRVAWGDGAMEERLGGGTAAAGAYDRTLIKGTLRGSRDVAGWSLTPVIGLTLIEETPSGLPRDTPARAPSRDGRVEFTPEIKKRVPVSTSVYVEPSFAAGAFLSLDDQHQLTTTLPSPSDVQLKAEAGMAVGVTDGVTVKAQGGVETTGAQSPDVWSGRLQLNMPLGK